MKFWTLPKKIAFTILLAVVAWYFFGCNHPMATKNAGDTNVPFLEGRYTLFNESYYGNSLPKNVKFAYELSGMDIAITNCNDEGTSCVMNFNPHYAAAPRVAEGIMLHEMCHVKTWTATLEKNRPSSVDQYTYDHGPAWQSCMLGLDREDAFRRINIDLLYGGQ